MKGAKVLGMAAMGGVLALLLVGCGGRAMPTESGGNTVNALLFEPDDRR